MSGARILNAAKLAGHGHRELRELALRVAESGLAACDAGVAAEAAVCVAGEGIEIAGRTHVLGEDARVIVVGSGKATLAIAAALERRLGDRIDAGAVVVREGEATIELRRIEVLVADHPLPTERSVAGARRLVELASGARDGDLVIASFTGGSSALTSLPPEGVSSADKRKLHELLLASGAPITEVNAVRKHVSDFKGGRLAARVAPATLVNLTVSDVAGDPLDTLTDPSVQDGSSVGEAVAILRRRGLWDSLPPSIRDHLASGAAESPRLEHEPQSVLLVTGRGACEAMVAEARAGGAEAHVVSTELEGEARELGSELARLTGEAAVAGAAPRVLVGCGGEASVSLGATGAFGEGGPNQEVALATALALPRGAAVAACFLDTDGSDGGTEAAGAIVDGRTVARAAAAGVDLEAALEGHRSGHAFARLGDQVRTGPTETNVNDLFVIAVSAAQGALTPRGHAAP